MVDFSNKKWWIVYADVLNIPKWRIFAWLYLLNPCINALSKVEGKVLDVGCGAGGMTRTILKELPHLKFYGIDIFPAAIKVANNYPSDIEFRVGNAEKLPFQNEFFSAVISFETLEHVENPQKVISEISRVLKKNGIFYFTTPLEGDPSTLYYFFHKYFRYNVHEDICGHINHFSYKKLVGMLTKESFEIEKKYFCAHFIQQAYGFLFNILPPKFSRNKIMFIPNNLIRVITGVESLFMRKLIGLDLQIVCRKIKNKT